MSKRKGDKQREQSIRRARHERREKAHQAKAEERIKNKLAAPTTKFTTDFGPDVLEQCGPQLLCEWGVPEATANALRAVGRPVAANLAGALLLDTGATRTCIALQAAIQLGLQPTRMQDGIGAGGEHSNPVFLARLRIKIVDPISGKVHHFEWEQEVEGISELHRCAAPLVRNGRTIHVSGLLGRDILKHARINYDGPGGKMRFEFDVASIQNDPSR